MPIAIVYQMMMIWNIVDRRKRRYRWKRINAIVEAVEHDNSCDDSDQAPQADVLTVVDYDDLEAVSVQRAINWANSMESAVTLYLYDEEDGISSDDEDGSTVHFNESSNRF